jgi:hypothetical protein
MEGAARALVKRAARVKNCILRYVFEVLGVVKGFTGILLVMVRVD